MTLTADLFRIDAEETIGILTTFIRTEYGKSGRDGIVVPISGGLDSSVVAALCVKAVGAEKITGLMLPERQGNPEAAKYAKMIARHLGIKTGKSVLSPVLQAAGVYNFPLSFFPTKRLRDRIARKYMKKAGGNNLIDSIKGSESLLFRRARAMINTKQRIRAVMFYKYAEERNLLTVGSAHLTEDMVGLFVKFGIDDDADLMPVKNLFRTQILHLAGYLKLPSEITGRSPNPDIIPGIDDKYLGMLGVPADKTDLALYGLLHGMDPAEIAGQLEVDTDRIEEIQELIRLSYPMRNHSLAPLFPV